MNPAVVVLMLVAEVDVLLWEPETGAGGSGKLGLLNAAEVWRTDLAA